MEIIPGIHQVDGVNGNVYIIANDHLTMIDAGLPGSGAKILSYIKNVLHREPAEIQTIVLTHFHTDHIGGVRELKNVAPGLKIAVHEADAGYTAMEVPLPRYKGLSGLLLRVFITLKPASCTPDILLKNGDRIDTLTCIHLPGHTPGSIGLLDTGTKTLFAGDAIRSDGISLSEGPVGFTIDLPRSRDSLHIMAGLEFETLLVGHGNPLLSEASARVREFAGRLPVQQ